MPQDTSWTAWNRPGGNNTAGNFNFSEWFNPGDDWGQTHTKGNRWGSAASGAASGAATGATVSGGNPFATGAGAVVGAVGGFLSGGPKELSPGEQWVNNWDVLGNEALKQFGPGAIGRQTQRMGQASQSLDDLIAQGTPDMSQALANMGQVEANIGRLSNYDPKRIDRQMGDWRKLMESGAGSIINPSMLASNQQYQEAMKAVGANPYLSAQQKALMQAQGQRGLAQTNALAQGQAIQAGMSALDDLAKTGDTLVQRALEAASHLGLSATHLRAQLAMFPYEYQMKLISLLSQDADQYAAFLKQFTPGEHQYDAAGQGGRTGMDWMKMLQQGAQVYRDIKTGGGGGGNNLSNFQGGSPSGYGPGTGVDWSSVGRTRDF